MIYLLFGACNLLFLYCVLNKIITISVLVVLVVGSAYSAWLFLKNDITVTLAEGQNFQFKNFVIRILDITDSRCKIISGFDCSDWEQEQGIQLRVTDIDTNSITHEYLGEKTRNQVKIQGLDIKLLSIGPDNYFNQNTEEMKVSLKLEKN